MDEVIDSAEQEHRLDLSGPIPSLSTTGQENLKDAASSDTPTPHAAARSPVLLGEMLVKWGLVAEASVIEALEIQRGGDRRPLGEILVENGAVPRQAVRDALQAQCKSREDAVNRSIRVDVSLLDKIVSLIAELVLTRNQILKLTSTQKNPVFIRAVQRLNLVTTELQEDVMDTRMQPSLVELIKIEDNDNFGLKQGDEVTHPSTIYLL